MTRLRSSLFRRAAVSFVAMLGVLPLAVAGSSVAEAAVAHPSVTGPITGGNGAPTVLPALTFPLSQIGYEESEFFVSGTATAYAPSAPLTPDGRWSVAPSATAPYTTRVVVRRPIDRKKFNGSVIVEWLNVTGGVDADPDWIMTHNELTREGFVWVGVSAQKVGVDATRNTDPVRYASLSHPGDSFSYDIYSQAGQAIRDDASLLLDGLRPRTVLAIGESQSASRLVTYINAVHPLAHEFDGFLVHSRFASGAALSQAPLPDVSAPPTTTIRGDLDVPVLVFETETDVANSNLAERQADTNRFRLWEVAGTSHYDTYGLIIGPSDNGNGDGAIANLAAMQNPTHSPPPPGIFNCNFGINTGGAHWVLDAAVFWLNQWVVHNTAPPIAPRLQVTSTSPVVFANDANGNVLGGIRTPQVDAPIAMLSGLGNGGSGSLGRFCAIFGVTVPFTHGQLTALYTNHGLFVSRWDRATQRDVKRGFLLRSDAIELKHSAAVSQIGK
jgi:hypothetical protein